MGTKERVGRIAQKVARILPGIGSYQDKESIRESDKNLRDYISARLTNFRESIERSNSRLVRTGSLSSVKDLDEISGKIDKLSRSITFASRGYAGVFDSWQSDEEGLSKLFEFDKSLKNELDVLKTLVLKISDKDKEPENLVLEELREFLLKLENIIKERESFLKGL